MIEARRTTGDDPDALALVEAMVGELSVHYGPRVADETPSATPGDFSPPGGVFVVLVEDARAVAGGGIKRLDAETGEVKRMFVVPEARSRGLARRLLAELEEAARSLGYRRVRLDTGDSQQHAIALYRSAGYREIPDYNDNRHASYWGEKDL